MRVAEKFISINGEGTRAGELAVFVRFTGCNLRCSYCDTMWANEPGCPYEEMSPAQICEYVRSTGIKNVTLTGGEPLLQKDMDKLISLLISKCGVRVEIETNGAVDLRPFAELPEGRPLFTMDYKLPSSGYEDRMIAENFSVLEKEDTVKFVSGSRADLERAGEIIEKYGLLDRCHVYFSPVFGRIEPAEIVDFMLNKRMNKARIQIQISRNARDARRREIR